MSQLSLFNQEPEERYRYKVRLTNIYGRTADDLIKYYTNEEKARQCLENWKNEGAGNTGVITSQGMTSLRGLIS
jgi:hypothetical protein